jgi:hypothetical protein
MLGTACRALPYSGTTRLHQFRSLRKFLGLRCRIPLTLHQARRNGAQAHLTNFLSFAAFASLREIFRFFWFGFAVALQLHCRGYLFSSGGFTLRNTAKIQRS